MPTPYLFFDGRAQEAIDFYQKALGAKLGMLMRFKESPEQEHNPPGSADKVMHGSLTIGRGPVMISDGNCAGRPSFQGFALSYDAADEADAKRRFQALADGGQVQMALCETFFAKAFGMVADRFGVTWMVIAGAKNP
jgi:PhnB protein